MTVNVIGSLIIGLVGGLVIFHHIGVTAQTIVGTGLCGGLTTWSSASWETLRLFENNEFAMCLLNAIGGLTVSLAAAGVGLMIVAAL